MPPIGRRILSVHPSARARPRRRAAAGPTMSSHRSTTPRGATMAIGLGTLLLIILILVIVL